MRPLWNGAISFGLVSIPVRMFSAVETHEGIAFDLLHKDDHSPIRYARICKQDGTEVAWEDIVKGYEYREGEYIVFTERELEAFEAKNAPTIDIQQFVHASEIDIRYFEKPYYLEPVKGGEKAYALLRSALESSEMLAIATYATHERAHLAAIRPVGRALVLVQMRFPSELRSGSDLTLPAHADVSNRELEVAIKLIKQETRPFIPEDYHDTYTEKLETAIKSKLKGHRAGPAKARPTAASHTTTQDLMQTLKASLEGHHSKK